MLYTPPPKPPTRSDGRYSTSERGHTYTVRLAFSEGPLEDGQERQGFLFFDEPLLSDNQATLKVKLVDDSVGEQFGTLSIPFEVR